MTPITPIIQQDTPPPVRGRVIGIGLALFLFVYTIGFAFQGEVRQIMVAGLESIPFMVLALLAYVGLRQFWARALAILTLISIVGGTTLMAVGLSATSLVQNLGTRTQSIAPGAGWHLLLLAGGCMAAILAGGLMLLPPVRRGLARILPLDPDSFVHAIALATIVSVTLISIVPLLVLATPPLLGTIQQMSATGKGLTNARGDAGMLRDLVYGLIWLVPATIFAVGYGVQRNLSDALKRLGLVRPTWQQVLGGLVTAVLLVGGVQLLSMGVTWLWQTMGWPETDGAAFGELLSFAFNPLGAVIVGVTAGLGEELAVRGVLQPRMGILLSNLFFMSLHAYQYNWDSLLVVFIVGTICGLVRQRTNTTTSAIVHGTYNFLLIMLEVVR